MKRSLSTLFKRCTAFLGRHKVASVLLLLVVVGITFSPLAAFAEEASDTSIGGGLLDFQSLLGVGGLLSILAVIFDVIGSAIGWMITLAIGTLISILQYNSFGQSFIVELGWPIVRDLVNMSIIIILLVIAVRTMLGMNGGAQGAQQQLPRLFIGVILVNFSKTITLLLIDISQVVLFTFVNALDVAAGNFIELFRLNDILSSGFTSTTESFGSGLLTLNAGTYLIQSYLKVVILGVIAMTLIVLTLLFIYRVIVLWILIILSPAAYFGMSLKSLIPGVGGAVSQWQKKLVGALTIGPVMVFFLWLSLAASSQGQLLATTEGINVIGNGALGTEVSQLFNLPNMVSMVIGIGLLFVGMQMAASSASSLGGFAATAVNKLQSGSKKFAIGAAKATLLPAKAGINLAAPELSTVGKTLGNQISTQGDRLRGTAGGSLIAPVFTSVGGSVTEKLSGRMKTADEAARKGWGSLSEGEQIATLSQFLRTNGQGMTADRVAVARQGLQESVFDEAGMRKKFKDNGEASLGRNVDDKELDSLMDKAYTAYNNLSGEERAQIRGSEKDAKDAQKISEYRNLHRIAKSKPEKVEEILSRAVQDNKVTELSPEFLKEALVSDDYRKMLEKINSKSTDKNDNGEKVSLSLFEQLKRGINITGDQREVVDVALGKKIPEDRKDFIANNVGTLTEKKDKDGNVVIDPATSRPILEPVVNTDEIRRGIQEGFVDLNKLEVSDYRNNPTNIENAVLNLDSKVDLRQLTGPMKRVLTNALQNRKAGPNVSDGEKDTIEQMIARINRGTPNELTTSFGMQPNGNVEPRSIDAFKKHVEMNPRVIANLNVTTDNNSSRSAVAALNKDKIRDLVQQYKAATDDSVKREIKSALENARDAADLYRGVNGDPDKKKSAEVYSSARAGLVGMTI